MRIKKVEAFAMRMPPADASKPHQGTDSSRVEYGDYHIAKDAWSSIYSKRHETALIRIETDEGTVGWGEGQAPVSPRTVQTIVEDLCRPILLDRDPFDVEYLWYRMYSAMRERGHATGFYVDALAGVDLAFYDLLGKSLNKPAYKLLGGKFRDDVLIYAGMGGDDPEAVASTAREHVDEGYLAIKLHLRQSNRLIAGIVKAVREEVGPDVLIHVDVHGQRDVSGAIMLGRLLEELDCRWLEAPSLAEDVKGHAEIAAALDLQVATGEWLRTSWEWRQWIDLRGFDCAMPDIARTGLTEGKRISALCDAYNLPIAPHVGGGGILSVAASVQYSAAIPNFQILEHSHRGHANKGRIAKSYPVPEGGRFVLDEVPGLGVEIDEDRVREFSE
jgi:L-alanine-DL-glutamate epimerase-like enolase superfamily enzyme